MPPSSVNTSMKKVSQKFPHFELMEIQANPNKPVSNYEIRVIKRLFFVCFNLVFALGVFYYFKDSGVGACWSCSSVDSLILRVHLCTVNVTDLLHDLSVHRNVRSERSIIYYILRCVRNSLDIHKHDTNANVAYWNKNSNML